MVIGVVDFTEIVSLFQEIDDIYSNDETATFISFLFSSFLFHSSLFGSFSISSFLCLCLSINQLTIFSLLFSIGIVLYSNDDDDDDVEAVNAFETPNPIAAKCEQKNTAIDMLSSFRYRFFGVVASTLCMCVM